MGSLIVTMIYLILVCLMSLYQQPFVVSNGRVLYERLIANDWKEAVVACFNFLSHNLLGGTEEGHQTLRIAAIRAEIRWYVCKNSLKTQSVWWKNCDRFLQYLTLYQITSRRMLWSFIRTCLFCHTLNRVTWFYFTPAMRFHPVLLIHRVLLALAVLRHVFSVTFSVETY